MHRCWAQGFLSENPAFAQGCADNGIVFVGPTVDNLMTFGDKTSARAQVADGHMIALLFSCRPFHFLWSILTESV
jgi:acetyl/propionyl-CoA carboxylase alpha subunit